MTITYIGPVHPQTKLTDDDVIAMRVARAAGMAIATLAREFDVSHSYTHAIVTGRVRRDVGGPISRGQRFERPVDPWFLAASMGLSWDAAKLLASPLPALRDAS